MDNTINIVNTTKQIINRVFPSQFELCNEDSNGFKLINLLYGIDFNDIRKQLNIIGSSINFDDYDYSMDGDYNEVTIPKLSEKTIYGSTKDLSNIPIKITNIYEYENGIATRFELVNTYQFSEVFSNKKLIGIEYFRVDNNSGKLLLTFDEVLDTNSVQSIFIDISNTGELLFDTIQSIKLGIKEQSYEATGRYEVINVPSYSSLVRDYPSSKKITAINPETELLEEFNIEHYTPDLGYVWNYTDHTFQSIKPTSLFYINESGEKVWYKTSYNNPYYSYNPIIKLEHQPLPNTLKIYDMDNLLADGNLRELTANQTIYYHSGEYIINGVTEYHSPYIGYDEYIPESFIPDLYPVRPVSAVPYSTFNYTLLPEDSYIDEQSNYFMLGSSTTLGPYLQTYNSIGRLIVTYEYTNIDHFTYITSLNSTRYIKYSNGDYLLSETKKNTDLVKIPVASSIEPFTTNKRIAAVFDGLDVRPGSKIDKLDITAQMSIRQTKETPYFSSPINGNIIGSTLSNEIIPVEYNPTQLINTLGLEPATRITNNTKNYLRFMGSVDINCNAYDRYIMRDGPFYLRSNFIPLSAQSTNRVLDINVKYFHTVSYPVTIGAGSNLDGSDLWVLQIDEYGYINFYDSSLHLQSTDTIDIHDKLNIQIVSNFKALTDIEEDEYIIYATKNGYLQRMKYSLQILESNNILNTLPISVNNYSTFVINNSVDVYDISIYDTEQ